DAGKPTFKVLRRALTVAPDNVRTAPPSVITGSVGRWERGARNLQADVETVQRLLESAAQKLQASDLDPKGVDGKIARQSAKSNTIAAIEAFQKRSNILIDGLIEPGGQTWQALLQAAGGTHPLPNNDFQTFIQEISVSLDDPDYAAAHGCVRLESEHVARLIQDNARVDETQVVVTGTWTKPSKQWS